MPGGDTSLPTRSTRLTAPTTDTTHTTENSVFVDDSGTRKRLLRIIGILAGLLSISFLGIVGVALATPTVATTVGLGNVVPFVIPGAAAPPPAKAPAAPRTQVNVTKPKTEPRPAAAAQKPAPTQDSPATQVPTSAPASDDHHNSHKNDHNQHSDKTHHSSDKTHQTDHTGDQTGQTGSHDQGQQDSQQAPGEANTPAIDANPAAQ